MVDRDEVRRSYDALSETYASHRSENPPAVGYVDELVGELPPEARILDAGCGQGEPVLTTLADRLDGTGLDFSREQLGRARETAPAAGLVQGDLATLPFGDDAFDAVLSFWSLIHLPATGTGDAIAEFARVLRPGGTLVVNEGIDEWTGTNPDWLDTGVEMQWHLSGEAAVREHLQRHGFSITDSWYGYDTLEEDPPEEEKGRGEEKVKAEGKGLAEGKGEEKGKAEAKGEEKGKAEAKEEEKGLAEANEEEKGLAEAKGEEKGTAEAKGEGEEEGDDPPWVYLRATLDGGG